MKQMEIISRQSALKAGLQRYFTGRPCSKGHLAERFVAGWYCVQCARENQSRIAKTPEGAIKKRERERRYYAKNDPTRKKRRAYARKYYADPINRAVRNHRHREYRSTPEWKLKLKDYALRKKFGFGIDGLLIRVVAQGGVCANVGCEVVLEPLARETHVDHSDKTGEVRGILCHHCNTALGMSQEDQGRLLGLIAYIDGQKRGSQDASAPL